MRRYFFRFKGSLALFCLTGALNAMTSILMAVFFQKTTDAAIALNASQMIPLMGFGIAITIAESFAQTLYDLAMARLLRKTSA